MFFKIFLDSIKKKPLKSCWPYTLREKEFAEFLLGEVAETKSMQINNFSQQNEHPLISEIEPVEEED